jgi:7,8-dihydroneopterin aldolase/epimerase/oxygenase
MSESIVISGLAVQAYIGVPEEERAVAQTLWIDVEMHTAIRFSEMGDQVENTIDYAEVAGAVEVLAAARPRKLIETLAADVRLMIEQRFSATFVKVTVRKKILPNTDYVAVVSVS